LYAKEDNESRRAPPSSDSSDAYFARVFRPPLLQLHLLYHIPPGMTSPSPCDRDFSSLRGTQGESTRKAPRRCRRTRRDAPTSTSITSNRHRGGRERATLAHHSRKGGDRLHRRRKCGVCGCRAPKRLRYADAARMIRTLLRASTKAAGRAMARDPRVLPSTNTSSPPFRAPSSSSPTRPR